MKKTDPVPTEVSENGLTVAEELAILAADTRDHQEGPFRSAAAVIRALDIGRHAQVYGE